MSTESTILHDLKIAHRLSMFRRKHINESQNVAAQALGIAQSKLSYMESGKMPIRYDFITKLVKEYGLNQNWLTTGEGEPRGTDSKKPRLTTDIAMLNQEFDLLRKQIKFMEANQKFMLDLIGKQNETIKILEAKVNEKK